MRRAVIDLNSPRPVWRVPGTVVETIRRALGRGWDVVKVGAPSVSDGDGASASPEATEAAGGAEFYLGWGVPAAVAAAARGTLRWAHTASAGVLASLSPEFLATGAVLTNSRGIQADPMADWTIAAVGYCVRGFHAAVWAQQRRTWVKDDFTDGTISVREFAGTRIGIVGLGGVGRAVARRCRALGMEVGGTRRRAQGRRPAGVRWVGGPDELCGLAARSDVLVITAPHTAETERLVDDAVLAAMPADSFLINVSRGALVDEDALVRHLDEGHLAGCVLDVFAMEPLPSTDRLWGHPKVLITPHVSAVSTRFWERETALILENIERYLGGRCLKNVVKPEIGY